MASSNKSSFSAFNDVDESVAKPVLGSDGAARWQNFKGSSKLPTTYSVAPAMPLKKLDRALGTKSIRDEQANEAKIRREAGDRDVGSGYTVFKRKSDHEEIAEQKRKKLVLERVRPDDVPYFLQADAFEGYKFDYVFTTREGRGTGYYWDGTDSMKKELGQPPTHSTSEGAGGDAGAATGETEKPKTKKKKKKKARDQVVVPEVDEFNPMEQVAQAILRRQQAMEGPPTSVLGAAAADNAKADAAALGADTRELDLVSSAASAGAAEALDPELAKLGWESAKDPGSGKVYYFRRSTNERSWQKPQLPTRGASEEKKDDLQLPNGWKLANDQSSGKVYYYHSSGKTSWERPIS